ncbi:uncharacterized protein LOC125676946 isoform X3 [Ostrea edulis]|uniref:uncharacterized protein LOC125676946 isoform X3 n=1 Tax=Ostrea edulis TaxID=37623 RepID=UPI0020944B7A|nr:uncharacterized protein LOC125676946 isoform X3 [Ostrea edulis]
MRGTKCLYSPGDVFQTIPSLMPGHTVQHPAMIGLSPIEQAEVILTGYRDCAAEAIRYLVEEERFAVDDPIVLGLRKHLYEQQRALNIHRILSNLENNPVYLDSVQNVALDDSGIDDVDLCCNENHMTSEVQVQNEAPSEPQQSAISTIPPEVDRDAVVSLAEEILSLIELEDSSGGMEEMEMEEEEELPIV